MGDLVQGIGDIFGANAKQSADTKAASQQAAAAQQAIAVEQNQYAQTRQDESPWRVSGEAALQQLGQLYGLNVPTGTYSDLPGGYAGNTGQPSTVPQASTPTSQSTKSFDGVSEGGISAQQAQSILSSRSDVQQAYDNLSSQTKGYFGNDPNNYAAFWYNKYGQPSGYQLASSTPQPVSAATAGSSTTNTASAAPADASGTAGSSSSPFWASPDYAFTLQQGLAGVDAGAAAGGMQDSGATRKAEIQYAGNLASGQYDNYVGHLSAIANSGQTAANTTATAGTNAANQVAATTTTAGNNAAASTIQSGNISAQEYSQLAGLGSSYANNNGGTASQLMNYAGNAVTFLGG